MSRDGCYHRRVSLAPLGVLLALLQAAPAAAAPSRPPAPAGLSWEDSDALAVTLKRIDRRIRSGRPAASGTLVVTERQVNSYVNLALAAKIPPALSDLRISLQKDRLSARASLDLDQVKSKIPASAGAGLVALLSGSVPVELRGRLSSSEGTGRVDVEEALVGGVSLPPSLLAQIVSQSTRSEKRPGGFDILEPFPLPFTARRLRLEAGRALVDFFP